MWKAAAAAYLWLSSIKQCILLFPSHVCKIRPILNYSELLFIDIIALFLDEWCGVNCDTPVVRDNVRELRAYRKKTPNSKQGINLR